MNNLSDSTGKLDDVIWLAREYPWFPHTGNLLSKYAEQRLLAPRDISFDSYGTHRYLSKNSCAPRHELGRIWGLGNKPVFIERLPSSTFEQYNRIGLYQLDPRHMLSYGVLHTIQKAYRYFDEVPSLRQTVDQLVHCIHILEAEGELFDVSHSDPEVPLSVFISVPKQQVPNAALRVCESILHESMHLQLTLLEYKVTLVSHCRSTLRSPWRSELRPPRALLHGIYVFSSILDFFRLLEPRLSNSDALYYVHRRRSEIVAELRSARANLRSTDLTDPGNLLYEFLAARMDGDYR